MTPGRRTTAALLVLGGTLLSCTGEAPVVAPRTAAPERAAFLERTIRETIEAPLTGPLTDATEEAWQGAFWAMGLTRYRSETTDSAIARAFDRFAGRSAEFQRALLEVVHAVAAEDFRSRAWQVLGETRDPRTFAMAALLITEGAAGQSPLAVRALLHERFPSHATHPVLLMLDRELARAGGRPPDPPPLRDLLRHPVRTGAVVLFSLQRRDRRFEGRAVVRRADGRFLREEDGSLFSAGQLALSASDMAGYLTNGNTPEGILSFQGFGRSPNVFIGPTETIELVLPHEATVTTFLHGAEEGAWSVRRYASLLPPSWRDYMPACEAYYAGAAGRTEIIAHGTTINPAYYRGEPFYPSTPSLGCLTARETWSDFDGRRMESEQQRLVDALRSTGAEEGYCVVVAIDDRHEPVSADEVRALVEAAEAGPE